MGQNGSTPGKPPDTPASRTCLVSHVASAGLEVKSLLKKKLDVNHTEDSNIQETVSDVLDFIKIANFDPVEEASVKKQNRQLKTIGAKSNNTSIVNKCNLDRN